MWQSLCGMDCPETISAFPDSRLKRCLRLEVDQVRYDLPLTIHEEHGGEERHAAIGLLHCGREMTRRELDACAFT